MATTNGNRPILDLKKWEFCTPAPQATAAAHFIVSSRHYRQQQLLVTSNTAAQLYNPNEDAWINIPSPALAGTFGAGACGTAAAWSTGATAGVATLTATAGTTTSITTDQTLVRDLRGFSVQFIGGTNAGKVKEIASNTIGTNSVITFTSAEGVAFDNTSTYRLLTPNFFVVGAGTLATGSFKRYDFATNTWVTLNRIGLPTSIGTDGRMIATPSWILDGFKSFATGTATSGTANTISNSAKNWATNQWTNYQIRITEGTGAGQIRTIASNTGTEITVLSNWGTNPDNTSQYSIEGNDDFIYFMGSNAVTLYRYSISADTWSTITPTVARSSAPGAGMGGQWVHSVSASDWTDENNIKNGRYIYSFRGAITSTLHRYDIASNAWAEITYAPAVETFTTGTKYAYVGDRLYIHKDATGRWFAFDFKENAMQPFSTNLYPGSTAVLGDTAFDVTYKDGSTNIDYIYMLLNTSNIMLRVMII